jgi:hypothetical protein
MSGHLIYREQVGVALHTRVRGGVCLRVSWRDGFWYYYYFAGDRASGRCFAPGGAYSK